MSADDERAPRELRGGLHLALLAAAFAGLMAWTWGTWPDVLVDFGRELYVPWQMCEGRVLFRDLAWFNGPLSPHWNAALFRSFGVGLATLVWVNAALFAASLALLHYVVRSCATRGAASVACLVVMLTCGFGQQVGIGNYNQLCPYSHEATHGLLLGLAALALVVRWRGRGPIQLVLGAGLCVGLAFLTKPETFVAALAGSGAALALYCWSARFRFVRALVAFALGLLTALLLSWSLLAPSLGSDAAWSATLGAWPQLARSGVSELAFYRTGMGFDAPLENLGKLLLWALGMCGVLLPGVALARWLGPRVGARATAGAAALATAGLLAALWPRVPWSQLARPWPLFASLAFALSIVATFRHRGLARWPAAAGLAAFALAMLAKMLLNARLGQYGFTLALPATALVSVALWSWLPAWLERRSGGGGAALRTSGAMALTALCAVSLAATKRYHDRKDVELGSGSDRMRTDLRGRLVQAALDWLAAQPRATDRPLTVAVLPEGVTVNYLARLANPTPYCNFMPPELLLFGEERIVESFRDSPPDFVLLTHKDTSEYGVPWFGRDYGRALFRYVMEHYRPVALFGDPPLGLVLPGEPPLQRPPVFGIRAFVRADSR